MTITYLSFEVTSNISIIIVTSRIRSIFPLIIFNLIVSISDKASSVENDIRLGDVIISKLAETFNGVI